MNYRSTRGNAPEMSASGAIIKGIAADKGLYVPESFPRLEPWSRMAGQDYKKIAAKVLAPYLSEFSAEELKECIDGAYDGKYSAEEIVPVKKAGGAYFLELYHGPTAAFKDMALQLMPRLLVKSMEKNHEDKTVVILVSTSGDTGTAALKGFENVPGTQIVVFFPDGAVSPVQERQMRTASGSNAHVFSILGNFDDAQTTQKQILSDDALLAEMEKKGFTFSAANSMNVGRLIPQIVYYVWGYARMIAEGAIFPGDEINICVPSGNFGNILSAYYAMRMGVPVKKLICASNKNKVLTDFMNTGIYDANREFFVTNSPSMDILISSNLERLLYHLADEDAGEVRSLMDQLSESGRYQVSEKVFGRLSETFAAGYADEDEIKNAIGELYADEGYLMDTHTAVGYKVWKDYAERTGDETPTLIASTASPYKFAASIADSIGIEHGADEFETIERLFIATGYPVPSGLEGLRERTVVHKEAIKREDMKERVRILLGLGSEKGIREMDLNSFRHIHFLGIGGIGVSAIAEIMHRRGVTVTGSDMKQSTVTDHLEDEGIKVFIGHAASNAEGADLLVYSSAVSMENPEIVYAREKGVPVMSRAEALGLLMKEYPVSIAVSGTHGKTTTTSMVSLIMQNAGLDPTILVGGILNELHSNVRIGGRQYFVTEACEYMDSFLELAPKMEIILNIDSDHLDYFKDIYHIAQSFKQFADSVPEDGTIIAYDANPFVKSVTEGLKCRVCTFGFSETSDFYARNISFDEMGHPSYDLYHSGSYVDRIKLSVPGEHNVANSLAAIAAVMSVGMSDMDVIKDTLEAFRGTQRRFDIIGRTRGLTIVDDYAHHPTEIKATLAAAQKLSHRKIWCLFQPHTYTRTLALMDQFADAFADADVVCLAEIYAAREKNIYKLSSAKLLEDIKQRHPDKEAAFFGSFAEMADYVLANACEGDVVITMGAGDIYRVGTMILEKGGQK